MMPFTPRFTAAFFTISFCLLVLSFSSAVRADEKPDNAIVVKGQVVDEAGKPVEGAQVSMPWNSSEEEYSATSNSEGRFELKLKPDFHLHEFFCVAMSRDRSQQGFVLRTPELSEIPESVMITLKPVREIPVVVSKADGEPVADAELRVVPRFHLLERTRSDPSGRATLKVPEGYNLRAIVALKNGEGLDYVLFQNPNSTSTNRLQQTQDHDDAIDLTLSGARRVVVNVKDTEGNPIAGVRVSPLYFLLPEKGGDLNFPYWEEMVQMTDAAGNASFGYIPVNSERNVTFRASKVNEYKTQQENFNPASLLDRVEMTLPKLMLARGRVIGVDRQPVAGANITAIGGSYEIESYRTSATSDENGQFELMLAPNHYYMFRANREKLISPGVCLVVKEEVPQSGLILRVEPATRVYGRVTVGQEKTPQSGQRIFLRQDAEPDYYELPKELRISNPTNSRYGVDTGRQDSVMTDKEGRFEFWVGPGKFMLMGPKQTEAQAFVIDEQKEKEINLHAERPDRILLKGRVVYRDDPTKPLAHKKVYLYADGADAGYTPPVRTDAEGRFEIDRPYTPCIAYASNESKTYASITRIELEQKQARLELQPTSLAAGRLISSDSEEPLPGEEIHCGVRVYTGEPGNSPWMTCFGGTALTAADGSFTLKGLLPGFDYVVTVVTERDSDGHPNSWRTVGHVELDKTGDVDLGDLVLSPGYKPLTLDEWIDRAFANDTDLAERVQSKLRDARLGHQHLMAMITFQNHPFCSKFFETKYDFENPGRKRLYEVTANFEMFAAQPPRLKKAADLPAAMTKLGQSLAEDDSFVLAAVSETGELLGTAQQKDLETDGELDLEKMYAFLNKHKPDLPDAQVMVEEALAEAKRENKRVLWQESGAFCGPCILLSRYLDKHRELIEKDYIWVKVDRRYAHGQEMVDKYRSEEGGIPWFVIMDADGKPLITSTSDEGNIGYPSSDNGRAHFEKMLRETAQRLTNEEIEKLLETLND